MWNKLVEMCHLKGDRAGSVVPNKSFLNKLKSGRRSIDSPGLMLARKDVVAGGLSGKVRAISPQTVIELRGGHVTYHSWNAAEFVKHIHLLVHVIEADGLLSSLSDLSDSNNNSNGLLSKSNCSSLTGLLTYRDVRQIFAEHHHLPTINARRHCVVVSLPPIACLIMHDAVYLVVMDDGPNLDNLIETLSGLFHHCSDAENNSPKQHSAKKHLLIVKRHHDCDDHHIENHDCLKKELTKQETTADSTSSSCDHVSGSEEPYIYDADVFSEMNKQSKRSPFELAVLEVIIGHAFLHVHVDMKDIEEDFHQVISKTSMTSEWLLEHIHRIKQPVDKLFERVRSFGAVFTDLIDDEEYLKRMELTKYRENPKLYSQSRHDEHLNADLEFLLEYFDQEMSLFTERVLFLRQCINNREQQLSLKLALDRNRIMFMELVINVGQLGIGVGTLISGIFGMDPDWFGSIFHDPENELNVDGHNTIVNHKFYGAFAAIVAGCILCFALIILIRRRLTASKPESPL